MDEDDLLGPSLIRGVLLLGGVATVAYLAFQYWRKVKAAELNKPPKSIQIPVELPIRKKAPAVHK